MSLTPGTRLGPYGIVGQIGAGGMGEVYKAQDLTWTLDGKNLLIGGNESKKPNRVYLLPLDGGGMRPLTPEGVSSDTWPAPTWRRTAGISWLMSQEAEASATSRILPVRRFLSRATKDISSAGPPIQNACTWWSSRFSRWKSGSWIR